MAGRRMFGEIPTYPPKEYWLDANLERSSIETPLDERGFVHMDKLVELAKSLVYPEYQWESPFNDVHHLQWSVSTTIPKHMDEEQRRTVYEFRELVNQKMYTPRTFHNWIHWATIPSPIPDVEAMQYSIDAHRVARSLAKTAQLAVHLTRIKSIPEKKLTERIDEQFNNYNLYMENARLVPREFSLLKLEEVEVGSPEDLLSVSRRLGKLAVDKVPIRLRTLRVKATA